MVIFDGEMFKEVHCGLSGEIQEIHPIMKVVNSSPYKRFTRLPAGPVLSTFSPKGHAFYFVSPKDNKYCIKKWSIRKTKTIIGALPKPLPEICGVHAICGSEEDGTRNYTIFYYNREKLCKAVIKTEEKALAPPVSDNFIQIT